MTTAQQDDVELEALLRMAGGDVSVAFIQLDHLGVWLGHLLLGKTERSEAGHDIEMTLKNE